jgi:hypothetical protein
MRDTPQKQPVPPRALAISIAALAIPVATVYELPDWTSSGLGMLIWLTALIPAFLLSYYRGMQGVAVALAGGMAVITATQISVVAFQIAEPNWTLLGAIVSVYLAVSVGVATPRRKWPGSTGSPACRTGVTSRTRWSASSRRPSAAGT